MMAGIKGKNTNPELLLRKGLHARGFRFRLHDKALPGTPDIVLPRYRAVILMPDDWEFDKMDRLDALF